MSALTEQQLELELAVSRRLQYWLVLTHLLALVLVAVLVVNNASMELFLLVLCVFVSAIFYTHRYRSNAVRVARLRLTPQRHWQLSYSDGRRRTLQLSSFFLRPEILILNFTDGRWRQTSLALLADSACADQQRRLRCWLLAESDDRR